MEEQDAIQKDCQTSSQQHQLVIEFLQGGEQTSRRSSNLEESCGKAQSSDTSLREVLKDLWHTREDEEWQSTSEHNLHDIFSNIGLIKDGQVEEDWEGSTGNGKDDIILLRVEEEEEENDNI